MSGNKWLSTKVSAKLLFALDFHDTIQVVPLKYVFISLVIKSFVNPFVDIALAFFDSSFNSFLFDFEHY